MRSALVIDRRLNVIPMIRIMVLFPSFRKSGGCFLVILHAAIIITESAAARAIVGQFRAAILAVFSTAVTP